MSLVHEVAVECPTCGTTSEIRCWNSVNVSVDPSLKQKLLSGELTRFDCPECKRSTPLVYDLLYHDMDRKLLILLQYPDETGRISADPNFVQLQDVFFGKGYSNAVVHSLEELREAVGRCEELKQVSGAPASGGGRVVTTIVQALSIVSVALLMSAIYAHWHGGSPGLAWTITIAAAANLIWFWKSFRRTRTIGHFGLVVLLACLIALFNPIWSGGWSRTSWQVIDLGAVVIFGLSVTVIWRSSTKTAST